MQNYCFSMKKNKEFNLKTGKKVYKQKKAALKKTALKLREQDSNL